MKALLRRAGLGLVLVLLVLTPPLWALIASPVFTIQASAVQTASGNSGTGVKIGPSSELLVFLDITAVSGTSPSLTVTVEVFDGVKWYPHTSFPAKSAVGVDLLKLNNFGETIRVSWAISGTSPSFTFSVKGQTKG